VWQFAVFMPRSAIATSLGRACATLKRL
jgi:hypothetical protein